MRGGWRENNGHVTQMLIIKVRVVLLQWFFIGVCHAIDKHKSMVSPEFFLDIRREFLECDSVNLHRG